MKILFYVSGIPVHFFGVTIAIGMLAGIFVAYKEVKRKGLEVERLFDIALYSIISAVVGARLFYIIFYNLSYYIENPAEIIKINEGGLSIHGGLLGAFIFGVIYFRKHKLNFFKYADAIAPAIILGQAIGRVGCDVFGRPMSSPLPWGVKYGGQLVHPAQVYEFVLNYILFFILWRKRKNIKYDGQIFLWYVILFSINRGVVELFRTNPYIFGWFSVSHLLSLVFILAAVVLMYLIKRGTFGVPMIHSEAAVEHSTALIKDVLIVIGLVIVSMIIYYTAWL